MSILFFIIMNIETPMLQWLDRRPFVYKEIISGAKSLISVRFHRTLCKSYKYVF